MPMAVCLFARMRLAQVTRVMIHFSTTFVAFCRAVEDRGEKLLDCVDELSFASHPVLGDPQRLATNRRILLEKELEDVFLVESNPEMVREVTSLSGLLAMMVVKFGLICAFPCSRITR